MARTLDRPLVLAVLALGTACGRIGFDAHAPDALPGFAVRRPITIVPVAGAALTDVPISIAWAADPELAALGTIDASSLAITAADGVTLLDFEIVRFEGSTGGLDAWVRLPTLGPTDEVTLYLYGGGATPTPGSPWPTAVAAAWHMDPAAGAIRDSAHAHDSIAAPVTARPALVEGAAGAGLQFDGVDDLLEVPDPPGGELDFGLADFSYSAWVLVETSAGPYDLAFHKGGSSIGTPGYDLELGTDEWEALLSDGTSNPGVVLGMESELAGRWVQLAIVVDRSRGELRGYADGVLADTADLSAFGSLDTPLPVSFSRTGYPFRGSLDEVRIYREAVSDAWIASEHANLARRDEVVLVGAAEPL